MAETQDLAELEQAFAKDPTGPAFVALSSAYLQQGRFMEAMVVCKKGIKSQPDNIDGRLLLARVYAEQGKVPKALDEVKALLEQKPDLSGKPGADAHFFLGQMHEKSGRFEDAIESFKEALRKDKTHAGANGALKAKGIDWTPGPSAEEIAAAEAAKRAEEEAQAAAAAAEAQRQAEAAAAAQAAQQAAQAQRSVGGPGTSAAGMSTPPTTSGMGSTSGRVPRASQPPSSLPPFPTNDPAFQGVAGAYGMMSGPVPTISAGRRLGPGFTFGLGALLLLVIAAVVVILKINKQEQEEIVARWKAASKYIEGDTTGGHRAALKEFEAALKIDDEQAHVAGQYALSLAIISFERGEKELEDAARKAIEKAKKVADDNPNSVAAQMILLRNEGKAAEAVELAKKLNSDEAQLQMPVRVQLGKSYAALGKVPEMMKVAHTMKDTPNAAVLAFVGEAYRRIGDHGYARVALDGAMKNELDHDPSRALRALVILEDDDITNLDVAIDDLNTLKELGKDAVGVKQRGYASLGLALVGKKLGRPDRENDRELQAAKSTLRSDPEVPLFEAKQLLAADEATKAIPLAQEAIKLDKVRLEPYLTIVDAAAKAKQWAAADQALTDAQAVFGDNLELGLAKSSRFAAEGKWDQAIAQLKGMIAAHDVAEVYRELGKLNLRKEPQDVNGAVDWLKKAAEKAAKRAPGVQANVYTWLGRAYAGSGDHKQAKEIYAQSLAATTAYSQTYYWIGLSLIELGERPAAKDALTKYLRAEPNGQFKERASAKLQEL
jgi:lipopolysaccharide biosynthesis regulator YciM